MGDFTDDDAMLDMHASMRGSGDADLASPGARATQRRAEPQPAPAAGATVIERAAMNYIPGMAGAANVMVQVQGARAAMIRHLRDGGRPVNSLVSGVVFVAESEMVESGAASQALATETTADDIGIWIVSRRSSRGGANATVADELWSNGTKPKLFSLGADLSAGIAGLVDPVLAVAILFRRKNGGRQCDVLAAADLDIRQTSEASERQTDAAARMGSAVVGGEETNAQLAPTQRPVPNSVPVPTVRTVAVESGAAAPGAPRAKSYALGPSQGASSVAQHVAFAIITTGVGVWLLLK